MKFIDNKMHGTKLKKMKRGWLICRLFDPVQTAGTLLPAKI